MGKRHGGASELEFAADDAGLLFCTDVLLLL
jgi:hypothetical protein